MIKLKEIHPHAAGIDIGSEKVFIGIEEKPVKSFNTFTESFCEAVQYLKEHGIQTVAMEATGVYWVVLYEMLEENGIEVYVVNPSQLRYVPGRKSDVQDCQWLQQLHSVGLLNKSFIPTETIRQLRSYVRLREDHIQMSATHVLHMQKALTLMNIRLHQVISQIQGISGLRIIEAILKGEHDPQKLVLLCDKQIQKKKSGDVIASLKGNYKKEHLFALGQAYDCWKFYQDKITECDQQIDNLLQQTNQEKKIPANIGKGKAIRHHKPHIEDFRTKMMTLTEGKDPTVLPGITDYTIMQIIAEVGLDLSRWPTERHFTSWLGLAPKRNKTGKTIRNIKAGQIFRETAQSLLKSKNIALGAFGRRLRSRKGPMIAVKAMARKLAAMFHRYMTKGIEYVEKGIEQYELQYQRTMMKLIQKKAKEFNLQLVPIQPT